MTEHLSVLLQREADDIAITPAPLAEILAEGRGLRRRQRRRTAATALVGLTLVLGTVGGSWLLTQSSADRVDNPVAATESYLHGGAFSVGQTIYFGPTDDFKVTVDEKIKSMYYTSAGVLVRTGKVKYLDDGGPSHYLLVRPDGSTSPVSLDLGDRAPDTDPTQPYLAYADEDGNGWAAVVYDVDLDREVARVPFTGAFTWGGWLAPPVALSGDHMYVGMDDGRLDINWRSGDVLGSDPAGASTYPEVEGSHVINHVGVDYDAHIEVKDVRTGALLLNWESGDVRWVAGTLSPSGRYLAVLPGDPAGTYPTEDDTRLIYDVATGERLPDATTDAWTPDERLLSIKKGRVSVCEPRTGVCKETQLDVGSGAVRIADTSYES